MKAPTLKCWAATARIRNSSTLAWSIATVLTAVPLATSCSGQNLGPTIKRGEQVFETTCATGYCHGPKGGPGGAPRLASRGFGQTYISTAVTKGISETGMPSFAGVLPPEDIIAVVAYVATLNGITNPDITPPRNAAAMSPKQALAGEAAMGAQLFRDALRGFERCSTCHAVGGFGIPIAPSITHLPGSVAELKELVTPDVKTANVDGENMPVLVLGDGKQGTTFYDLTSLPPVFRKAAPGTVKLTEGSTWRHSSVIQAYKDSEVSAILTYLSAIK